MAKYQVEVGGFVSTYRQRTYIVFATSEEEAKDKAADKFIKDQQNGKPGNMCDEGTVNYIFQIK
jgi:hypothetical protein